MTKSAEAFRTISEVSTILETPTHVLRFWESRFPQIKPVKRAGGRRYYRPEDVQLLGGIKRLLHHDGMAIRGVQKLLKDEGVRHVMALSTVDLSGPFETEDATPPEAPSSATPIVPPVSEMLSPEPVWPDAPELDPATIEAAAPFPADPVSPPPAPSARSGSWRQASFFDDEAPMAVDVPPDEGQGAQIVNLSSARPAQQPADPPAPTEAALPPPLAPRLRALSGEALSPADRALLLTARARLSLLRDRISEAPRGQAQ